MWESTEGHAWMYLGGVGHVELIVGFFGLTMRMEYISENTYIV